ncbi:MAG: OmpA family protein [Betaproteobacteria bacterium]|nr:OmpA family protein [Betaproteobacteria bacterium]
MKRMVMKSALSFMALSFCLLGVHSSQAQSRGDASVEEIVQALTPPSKTRSMGRNMKVEAAKIDLTVNFDFDSAKLKEESRPQLERLAEALKADRLANLKFQVEGHTDAQGSSTYNEALSTRRAASVVSFLNQSGIEMQRLQSVGKGSTELLEPSDPKSAKNRRVRILTLE